MNSLDWTLLLALSVLWGGSFFLGEVALRDFGSFSVAFGRVAVACLALCLMMRIVAQPWPRSPRIWRDLFIMGAVNNALPFSLILWGQTYITGSLAAILNATTPLFTVLLASVLTSDEKLSSRKLFGVALGFGGVAVMMGAQALGEMGGEVLAELAVLGAAAVYALAAIFGKRFRGLPPLTVAAGQSVASSTLLLPLMLLHAQAWHPASIAWSSIAALVALGLLSSALAYLLYFRILASAGATNLMLVTFLIPVSAFVLGWSVLGETLSGAQVSGMALIALGLVVLDGRVWQRR